MIEAALGLNGFKLKIVSQLDARIYWVSEVYEALLRDKVARHSYNIVYKYLNIKIDSKGKDIYI